MFIIREVMYCKPGKVKAMVDKFKAISGIMAAMGLPTFRIATDFSGAPFWSVTAELEVASVDEFLALEEKIFANEEARNVMAGYHDLVAEGRREIYKLES